MQAQNAPNAGDAARHRYVIEVVSREQWLHARNREPSEEVRPREFTITVDSVARDTGTRSRTVFIRQGDPRYATGDGRLVVPATAAPQSAEAPLLTNQAPLLANTPKQARIHFLWRVLVEPMRIAGLSLPAEQLWDLVPSFHPPALVPGSSWRDTVRARAELDGVWQEVIGIRTSWLEADSSIAGRVRWLVRDSAAVRYRATFDIPDYDRETNPTVVQEVAGTIIGRYVHDDSLQLPAWRRDSTRWTGTARLQEAGRPALSTSARFERIRTWTGFTAEAYERVRQARIGERARRRSGVAPPPGEPAPVQPTVPDSALLLSRLGEGNARFGRRYSLDNARLLLDWVENPQRLWDWGVRRSVLIEPLTESLVHFPLALVDSSAWICAPEACDHLAQRGARSREPVARDLALLLEFSRAPRASIAAVRQRAVAEPGFFTRALYLAEGVGAWWETSTKPPVPAPGSSWHAWLGWLEGRVATGLQPSTSVVPQRVLEEPYQRFDSDHDHALRMHALVTGRNLERELQGAFDSAVGDTARFVLGTVALRMRRTPVPTDTLRAWFRSGARLLQRLAAFEVFWATAPIPPVERRWPRTAISPVLRDSILDGALQQLATAALRWRMVDEVTDSLKAAARGEEVRRIRGLAPRRDTLPRILVAEDWPGGVPARWQGAFRLMSRAEMKTPPLTPEVVVHSFALSRRGPFVLLDLRQEGPVPRPAGMQWQQRGAQRMILLDIDGEWQVVGLSIAFF